MCQWYNHTKMAAAVMSSLSTAQSNSSKLVKFLNMPDDEWSALYGETKSKPWWEVVSIAKPEAASKNAKVAGKLSTLRGVFASPHIQRSNTLWVSNLLDGKVSCSPCSARNFARGLLTCNVDKVGRHLLLDKHVKCVERLNKKRERPQKIDEIDGGVQPAAALAAGRSAAHIAAALVVGSFAAGTHGAAGVPPTSIPKLLSKDMLGLLRHELRNGIPASSTITTSTLPTAVALVEERIKALVAGVPLSLYIDGGSSKLACGRKVVCVCAGSMEDEMRWATDVLEKGEPQLSSGSVLLDVLVMEAHESKDTQVAQIVALVEKYGILPKNVHYLCADNASPNKATADALNAMGYNVIYARCLPHCLNLVVRAFMNVLDKEFKYTTNLKLMRHFLTAGGGVGRKLAALEFGFTVSGVDFCETRWASLVYAILYVANKQSPSHLAAANKRLQELADAGDATAQDALANPGPTRVVFNVIYDFVESLTEDSLKQRMETDDVAAAEASLPEAKKKLLKYFSQPLYFLAFQLIDLILGGDVGDKTEKLPSLFSITQGNPDYAARLKSSVTGEVPNAVNATRNLLRRLKGLHYRWTGADAAVDEGSAAEQVEKKNVKDRLKRVFDELERRAALQATAVVNNCKSEGHAVLDANEAFDQVEADVWVSEQADLFKSKLKPKLEAALAAAAEAVEEAAGLVKTEECIAGLEASQIFDVNKQPLDIDDDGRLLEHLCFKGAYPATETVVENWREYVADWRAPPKQMSPFEVYAFWKGKLGNMPTLARHAMLMFSRPMSSAACERVFSYLTHMDSSDRRNMKKDTLRHLLFLRGNHEIFDLLVREKNEVRLREEAQGNRDAKRSKKH